MPLSVIPLDAPMPSILDTNSFTLGHLAANPLAASYGSQFDAFQATWVTASASRTALVIAAGKAQGAVSGADAALDDFVDTLDRTLLIAVKNDRKAPLYQAYFGLKAPNLLKRPILSDELSTCRNWGPSLTSSPVASLAALAPTLTTVVAAADAAVTQKQTADRALKDFDTIGGKKTLVDAYNTLRLTVYGELAALPHQNAAAMLPANFADRFFLHEGPTGVAAMTSTTDVENKIASIEKELAAAQTHLAGLTAKATAKAAHKAAEVSAAAALTQAKKAEAAAKVNTKAAKKAAKEAKKKVAAPAAAATTAAATTTTPAKGP